MRVIASLFVLLIPACGLFGDPLRANALQAQLLQNQALWANSGIKSYRFTYKTDSWAPFNPVIIEVREGQFFSAKDSVTGETLGKDDWQVKDHTTAEDLFAGLRRSIDAIRSDGRNRVSVSYDPQGFPKQYAWRLDDPSVADAFGGYTIKDFTPLP